MDHTHFSVFALLLVAATVTDFRIQKIPNLITFTGCMAGIVLSAFLADSAFHSVLMHSLAGVVLALVLFLPVYALGKFGAGDVKLLAMVGAFIGPLGVVWSSVFTLIAGGVLAVVWLVLKLGPRAFLYKTIGFFSLLHGGGAGSVNSSTSSVMKQDMPYAAAIGAGSVAGYLMVV